MFRRKSNSKRSSAEDHGYTSESAAQHRSSRHKYRGHTATSHSDHEDQVKTGKHSAKSKSSSSDRYRNSNPLEDYFIPPSNPRIFVERNEKGNNMSGSGESLVKPRPDLVQHVNNVVPPDLPPKKTGRGHSSDVEMEGTRRRTNNANRRTTYYSDDERIRSSDVNGSPGSAVGSLDHLLADKRSASIKPRLAPILQSNMLQTNKSNQQGVEYIRATAGVTPYGRNNHRNEPPINSPQKPAVTRAFPSDIRFAAVSKGVSGFQPYKPPGVPQRHHSADDILAANRSIGSQQHQKPVHMPSNNAEKDQQHQKPVHMPSNNAEKDYIIVGNQRFSYVNNIFDKSDHKDAKNYDTSAYNLGKQRKLSSSKSVSSHYSQDAISRSTTDYPTVGQQSASSIAYHSSKPNTTHGSPLRHHNVAMVRPQKISDNIVLRGSSVSSQNGRLDDTSNSQLGRDTHAMRNISFPHNNDDVAIATLGSLSGGYHNTNGYNVTTTDMDLRDEQSVFSQDVESMAEDLAAQKKAYNKLLEAFRMFRDEDAYQLIKEKEISKKLAEDNHSLSSELEELSKKMFEKRKHVTSPLTISPTKSVIVELTKITNSLGDIYNKVNPLAKKLSDVINAKGSNVSQTVVQLQNHLKCISAEIISLRGLLSSKINPRDVNARNKDSPESENVMNDLIHMQCILSEANIVDILEKMFTNSQNFIWDGPVLLNINGTFDPANSEAILSAPRYNAGENLEKLVYRLVSEYIETNTSQVVILNGVSGSGKTHLAQSIIRVIYERNSSCGTHSEIYKQMAAGVCILQAFTTCHTPTNFNSSRLGFFYEIQMHKYQLIRTKFNSYFLDQSRITDRPWAEGNYHIFYQMLAGLSYDERSKLHLSGYTAQSLTFLKYKCADGYGAAVGNPSESFSQWRQALASLGIPFEDVTRVLSAIMLLGNVEFIESNETMDLDVKGHDEIKSVAALLGVSGVSLYRGLTTRTVVVRGNCTKTMCNAATANHSRNILAKALYARTLISLNRRINNPKRPLTPNNSSRASDSSESVPPMMQPQTAENFLSIGLPKINGNAANKEEPYGFIGIVDLFGTEDANPNSLEQLCINLCTETLEYFYTTNVFRSTQDNWRDDCVSCDIELSYHDNGPCVDLISSQRSGIFSSLDKQSLETKGSGESFVKQLQQQNPNRPGFSVSHNWSTFTVDHYSGPVNYDTTSMIVTNRDVLRDDIVCVFQQHNCSFGFVNHLFAQELRQHIHERSSPMGVNHRILPPDSNITTSGSLLETEHRSTFCRDFHSRLDSLLKVLVRCKPQFVRCIKASRESEPYLFDSEAVKSQVRNLQLLETTRLMADGLPHKLRFRTFNNRYLFIPLSKLHKPKTDGLDDYKMILEYFLILADEAKYSTVHINWALGKRHIFLSEGARQLLEELRFRRREKMAIVIQKYYRGFKSRQKLSDLTINVHSHNASNKGNVVESRLSQLHRVPAVPPKRNYVVKDGQKLKFPYSRFMSETYPTAGKDVIRCGEKVKVLGMADRPGFLFVQYDAKKLEVPSCLMSATAVLDKEGHI